MYYLLTKVIENAVIFFFISLFVDFHARIQKKRVPFMYSEE